MIPMSYKIIALLVLVASLFAGGWMAYNRAIGIGFKAGAQSVQVKWDADKLAQAKEIDRLKLAQAAVTTKVETVYVDRVQVIREAGKVIIKEVTKYVPASTPDLPGGFRLLHDAAASGSALPDPSGIPDAAPVAAQDVASTVAENYNQCRQTAEQLMSLQAWVKGQAQVTAP